MSWDLFVQDIPSDANSVEDIRVDFEPRPLGRRSQIIRQICATVPEAEFSDSAWGVVDLPEFSVEFNMGEEEEVLSFTLHIRGGDAAAGLVVDLFARNGWRAFDAGSESGIFDPESATDSLKRWRIYRNGVAGSDAG